RILKTGGLPTGVHGARAHGLSDRRLAQLRAVVARPAIGVSRGTTLDFGYFEKKWLRPLVQAGCKFSLPQSLGGLSARGGTLKGPPRLDPIINVLQRLRSAGLQAEAAFLAGSAS
ncbi:unnamed protein product, partial [Prorocentrum cordatum]